jgi:hypothetical protein
MDDNGDKRLTKEELKLVQVNSNFILFVLIVVAQDWFEGLWRGAQCQGSR